MSWLSAISSIFKPATELIDNLHTSDEERLKLKNELATIQQNLREKIVEYEVELLKAKRDIILSEARGTSWLQRNWRPGMMVLFAGMLLSYWFGYVPPNLSQATLDQLFGLLKIGIGGYVVGRTVEKAIKNYKNDRTL